MKKYMNYLTVFLIFGLLMTASCNKDDEVAPPPEDSVNQDPDSTVDDDGEVPDPTTDYLILKAIYDANDNNALNWDLDDLTMTGWEGVTVTANSVTKLLLSEKALDSIPMEIGGLAKLNELDISVNALKTLPPETGNLETLRQLNVSSNALDSIPVELAKLTKLTNLNLESNALTRIPQEVCDLEDSGTLLIKDPEAVCDGSLSDYEAMIALLEANPNHLMDWDLTDTSMKSWTSTGFGFNLNEEGRVTTISDSYVLLRSFDDMANSTNNVVIPPEIGNLTELTVLTFSGLSDVAVLPKEVGNLKKLEYLDVGGGGLSDLPNEIWELENLIHLKLGGNNIKIIPAEIGNLKNLEIFLISDNQISNIPPEIGNLSSLTELYMSGNTIKNIPANIKYLGSLRSLNLAENEIESIPPEIGNLGYITSLRLNNNLLKEVPEELGNLRMLSSLHLNENEIIELPRKVCDLEFTVGTYIQKDPEVYCEDTLEADYHALIALLDANPDLEDDLNWDVNDTSMKNWEGVTISSDRVIELRISGKTSLYTIPPGIHKLSKLKVLDLSANNLKLIYEEIGELSALVFLSLNENKLLEIPEEIGNLTGLQELELTDNDLTQIPQKVCDLEKTGTSIRLDSGVVCK